MVVVVSSSISFPWISRFLPIVPYFRSVYPHLSSEHFDIFRVHSAVVLASFASSLFSGSSLGLPLPTSCVHIPLCSWEDLSSSYGIVHTCPTGYTFNFNTVYRRLLYCRLKLPYLGHQWELPKKKVEQGSKYYGSSTVSAIFRRLDGTISCERPLGPGKTSHPEIRLPYFYFHRQRKAFQNTRCQFSRVTF